MRRRDILRRLGASIAVLPAASFNVNSLPLRSPGDKDITNEAYWEEFRKKHYTVSSEFINLENGYFGVQPNVVLEAYRTNIDKVNQNSSRFMRKEFFRTDMPVIMDSLAEFGGVSSKELLLTRNATEALNILIQGYPWKKGDEILLQHHDYYSMIEAYQMVAAKKDLRLTFVDVPLVGANETEIAALYLDKISKRTRVIHLTHLTHLTGMVMPVARIAAEAKARGIDVIVDAAHSFAQVDYKLSDLKADFVGVNLHKWFGNPLGAGLMYVREPRIKELSPLFGDVKQEADNIQKLGHYGTPAPPIWLCIPIAAEFNNRLTMSVKESRLRYLQQYWTERAGSIKGVKIWTPKSQAQSCALASFSVEGKKAEVVVDVLDSEFGVFTVIRKLKGRTVVRVTPNLYNSVSDLDRLLEGIEHLSS